MKIIHVMKASMLQTIRHSVTLSRKKCDLSMFQCRIETLEASRCFNCGSYSHSLKECPKPRDNVAINNARKMHNSSKRNPTDRAQVRYYQKTPGKFDDLCAGVLGAETRECLGIGVISNSS